MTTKRMTKAQYERARLRRLADGDRSWAEAWRTHGQFVKQIVDAEKLETQQKILSSNFFCSEKFKRKLAILKRAHGVGA